LEKGAKILKIANSNYSTLLTNIKNKILTTQETVIQFAKREKILMSWEIGKLINEHLLQKGKADYGDNLFNRLENDLEIKSTVLYRMSNFYKKYPQLPEDNNLNWNHYRFLIEIKDDEKRKYLEELAIDKNLTSVELQNEIKKEKTNNSLEPHNLVGVSTKSKLTPTRGVLFQYELKKFKNTETMYLDCGFNISKPIETQNFVSQQQDGTIVNVVKNGEEFTFEKSNIKHKQINTYKGYVEKVVDGDTLVVLFDLGFSIFHKEIIRLSGIDAPEISTKEGKDSADALSEILKGLEIVIIKTVKTDIYGRYVGDVFFDATKGSEITRSAFLSPQHIADTGEYLNQILLDKGLAERLYM